MCNTPLLTILFDSCLTHRSFLTFSARRSSDSQLTPWRGPIKGSKPTERLFEKALNKILHSYVPFFISPLAREISRDKNVDVDWSSNNDADLFVCSIIEKYRSRRIVFPDTEDSRVFRVRQHKIATGSWIIYPTLHAYNVCQLFNSSSNEVL